MVLQIQDYYTKRKMMDKVEDEIKVIDYMRENEGLEEHSVNYIRMKKEHEKKDEKDRLSSK